MIFITNFLIFNQATHFLFRMSFKSSPFAPDLALFLAVLSPALSHTNRFA